MVITYHGGQFFKIGQGDILIGINPPAQVNRFGADIGIVSVHDSDFNGTDNLSYGDKQPLIISGPGEYERSGIFIKGFGIPISYKGVEKINTVYYFIIDSIRVCFLGALQKPVLSEELEEAITYVDLLFVPIGGGDVLNAADAYKIARLLEAKLIIPMHYGKDSSPIVKKFLEEAEEKGTQSIDKLTVRKKDFEGKAGEVVVLKQLK